VAVLETKLDNLRGDMAELVTETQRTRTRLHNLEGVAHALVDVNKQRAKDERARERRYARRINLLSFLVAIAAVASPIIVAFVHHG